MSLWFLHHFVQLKRLGWVSDFSSSRQYQGLYQSVLSYRPINYQTKKQILIRCSIPQSFNWVYTVHVCSMFGILSINELTWMHVTWKISLFVMVFGHTAVFLSFYTRGQMSWLFVFFLSNSGSTLNQMKLLPPPKKKLFPKKGQQSQFW